MLELAVEKVGFILAKAREFDVKVAAQGDSAGRPAESDDSDFRDILEDYAGDSTSQELADAIAGLADDEQVELVALFWLGRGDYEVEEWKDIVAQARERRNNRTPEYLMGSPMLAAYLEEGLAKLGFSEEDYE